MKTVDDYNLGMAKAAANYVSRCLFHVHRGMLDCGDKIILFGNDGAAKDERARNEIDFIREALPSYKINGHFLATSDGEAYSWAILILNYDRAIKDGTKAKLERLVWESWKLACAAEAEAVTTR